MLPQSNIPNESASNKSTKSKKSNKLFLGSSQETVLKIPQRTITRVQMLGSLALIKTQNTPSKFKYVKRLVAACVIITIIALGLFLGYPERHKVKDTSPTPQVSLYTTSKLKTIAPPEADPLPTLKPLGQCTAGTTDIIVAHEDDDLLFMNPDLAQSIVSGKCVRTIYITAGDDGHSTDYWKGREAGIERAYAYMNVAANNWTTESVNIYGHNVSVRHLADHPSIGLVFLRLPDGNVDGHGFTATGNNSLESLATNNTTRLFSVDGSTNYSYTELKALISSILQTDKPDAIFTHIFDGSSTDGDHNDHRQVGLLTFDVRNIVRPQAKITLYVGYPIGHMPSNLAYSDSFHKREIFLTYAAEDSAICHIEPSCPGQSTYTNYFFRQYKSDR